MIETQPDRIWATALLYFICVAHSFARIYIYIFDFFNFILDDVKRFGHYSSSSRRTGDRRSAWRSGGQPKMMSK